MLYNLLYPLSVDYSVLNIFKYITFRSAWALVTALAVSILVGPYFIRWLQAIKCRQEILKEVKAHQCKAGTPTMGGLIILVAIPLPGTGAWTGALVADVLDLRLRTALPAIALGVLIAGIITTTVTCGVIRVFW